MNTQQRSRFVLLSALAFSACFGCRPGYIKASDLESKGQGPAACAKTCEDLGMRMAALVLVGDTLPGCVCQPLTVQAPAPKAEPPVTPSAQVPPSAPVTPGTPAPAGAPAPGTPAPAPPAPSSASAADGVSEGAAAATTGYVVIAAAVAAQQTQQERQRQSQTPLGNY